VIRDRYAGLLVSVSDRALMSLAPILGSFAQLGTRPQRSAGTLQLTVELVATAYTGWVGATFQLIGSSGVSTSSTSSNRASVSRGAVEVVRPHMGESLFAVGKGPLCRKGGAADGDKGAERGAREETSPDRRAGPRSAALSHRVLASTDPLTWQVARRISTFGGISHQER
jgi:hypothetical protein